MYANNHAHTCCANCSPCRDRAEERRRGVNPDYATANQLASVSPLELQASVGLKMELCH